ncbi:zinc carboxypeptidase [Aliikangiella coralliicola]|uniref:Zinc carboxypeptidase n=1 Tax=Aliikangiella coralliicola TaxID=2592383 RepID=A0A545U770_9GAMM|nr:zinc carboxypeptidase [Aliikangiella coralliicola]TQV85331.1 zinc carboxypeptidase [Aliikangiella coralliicola]
MVKLILSSMTVLLSSTLALSTLLSTAVLSTVVLSTTASATQLTYTENDTTDPNNRALGYPVPVPVASQTPVDGFRQYDSLFARHQDMALNFDSITGNIIGQTRAGEDIWAYTLSDADNTTFEGNIVEGSMLQNGGIHAREWQSPEVVTGIIERFYDNQNDQGFYRYLLDNSRMIIIPVLNVDGFRQTQRYPMNAVFSTDQDDNPEFPRDGRMRRKNMLDVDTDLSTENDFLLGVDLNRNNSPYWATNPGRSSNRQQSIVHHGSGPGSEPETQALQAAAALAAGTLRFYIDTHSFTQIYFAPMTGNTRRDNITASIAARMQSVNGNRYAYGPSGAGAGIGSTDEYFANTFQVPSYTLETEPGQSGGTQYGGFGVSHDGFILPESEIARVRNELANASILGYYIQAGVPSIIQLQITRVDTGATVYLGNWQADSATSRSWQETANATLETDVNYRVRLSFNKTMRWRNNGQSAQYPGQSIAMQPTISLEGFDSGGNNYSVALNNGVGQWVNNVSVANDGYLNYEDDSYVFEFTLPGGSAVIGATLQQLAITVTDLAGQSVDANPATVATWQNGSWVNYESSDGSIGDIGGVDRSIRLVNDGSPLFTDPAAPPSGGGGSGGGVTSSGGGGSNGVVWTIMGLLALLARSKRKTI